ncbi:hypothetical protein B0J15DRAFT_465964 [Fusarium solani]|uniref:DUF676 domain-containing protein n=1 Tax=Fusarium solani TaxID=169388 RepID=A0A9P9HJH0_FUSSL|nr:uncharacterized protein B0J15DRAFT_465964 [Fusarium solani]KAH7258710.1 hypothetical protein B0J15DRAFT_465964 [Fusarium solani]
MAGFSINGPYGLLLCHEGDVAVVDIVFVHGLTGSRESTWTSKDKSIVFWPRDLLKKEIPDSRITSFGYDANAGHFWSMASQNHGRPIIFVAHSLGGLVVEDLMIDHRQKGLLHSKNSAQLHLQDISKSTIGIAFLGTPHLGADLARWADLLKGFKDQNNRDLNITCFGEELGYRNIGPIVPMHSAILPAYNSIGIRQNHVTMTKVESENDAGFQSVSSELWMWVAMIRGGNTRDVPQASIQDLPEQSNRELWPYGAISEVLFGSGLGRNADKRARAK